MGPAATSANDDVGTISKSEDVLIRHHAGRSTLDRTLSAKLQHRKSVASNRYSVEGLKSRYEELASPKEEKFTPASFGYPKAQKLRFPEIRDKNDENSNVIKKVEETTIVRKAPSIDEIAKIQEDLDDFTIMERTKEKKKSSFRKFFNMFNKDKHQKKKDEEKNKTIIYDNMTNESSFNRQAPLRHTLPIQKNGGGGVRPLPEVDEKFAEMHINRFNHIRQSFNQPPPSPVLSPDSSVSYTPPSQVKPPSPSPRTIDRNLNTSEKKYASSKPHFDDTYGTVFDSVDNKAKEPKPVNQQVSPSTSSSPLPKPLEMTKLRLPANREVYEVQPRVRSPISSNNVSTDKIIATELLKKSISKPPISPKSPVLRKLEVRTNAMVHAPSRSQTPSEYGSLPSPMENKKQLSPQIEDAKKQLQEYYWKEVKKMKEEEDRKYNMYVANEYYHQQASLRRSRSMSPSAQRNRRSVTNPSMDNVSIYGDNQLYGRIGQHQAIPENQALMITSVPRPTYDAQQAFMRSMRRPAEQTQQTYGPTRPIFRRGSLTKQEIYEANPYNKRVSFSSQSSQNSPVWPTRNGFTQSPPQRKLLERRDSYMDDDVFLPGNEQQQPVYGYCRSPPAAYGMAIGPRRMSVDSLARGASGQQYYLMQRPLPPPPTAEYGLNPRPNLQQYPSNSQLSVVPMQRNPIVYSSRQSVAESVYMPKQVTVHNKYADMYGQIHETSGQQSGVIIGKLQGGRTGGGNVDMPTQNFVRNSRLTQSAHNVSRYQQQQQHNLSISPQMIPTRIMNNYDTKPLPPAPNEKSARIRMIAGSDTESYWSDGSDIKQNKVKNKKRGLFGK